MKTVLRRPWWKIWRRPLFGLNPIGWIKLTERKPFDGEIHIEDEGTYVFCKTKVDIDHPDDVFIAPNDGTDHGVWFRADIAQYIMEIGALRAEIADLKNQKCQEFIDDLPAQIKDMINEKD